MLRAAACPALAAALALVLGLSATAAEAKTCKAEITAKSTSRSEFSQESRARDRALANWRKKAQAANGVAYRFWSLANGKSVNCTKTPKSTTCVATGTPCRPF